MAICAGALLVSAVIAVLWPRVVALPLAVVMGWSGATLMVRAIRHWRRRARQRPEAERLVYPLIQQRPAVNEDQRIHSAKP